MLAAAALLPQRWIAIGTGGARRRHGPRRRGYLCRIRRRRTGSDFHRRALGRRRARRIPGVRAARRLAPAARPDPSAEPRAGSASTRSDLDADTALARGRQLRAEIDGAPDPIGVLVVADGANTLTEKRSRRIRPRARRRATGPGRRAGERRRRPPWPGCRADPGAGRLPGAGRPDRAGAANSQGALPGSALWRRATSPAPGSREDHSRSSARREPASRSWRSTLPNGSAVPAARKS